MDDSTSKPKKPIYKKWWFWVLAAFVLIVIAASGSDDSQSGNGTSQNTNTVSSGTTETTEPASEPTWQVVKTWSGSGIKNTEPFTITGKQWRVNWTNNGGYLGVGAYKPGSALPTDTLVNSADAVSDTSYVYKSGEFYLGVNSSGSWKLTVEELK